tara:strand:- start:32 stop:940 length:909 start_codon:yes stop_codon:yes gene_type:complete
MKNLIVFDPEIFGLEESTAKGIKQQFQPMLNKMVEFEEEFNEVLKLDIENPTTAKVAKELRLKYVKVRTGTASIHKKQKAFYLSGGKFVDGWKNAQLFASQGKEEKLSELENYIKNLEIERKLNLQAERSEAISEYNQTGNILNLSEMSEEAFVDYKNTLKLGFEAKIEAEKKEALKVEKEKAEAEELKVKEAEERKEIEAENLRLKKEAEKKEVENKKLEKALREKKEAEDQERKKIEANKKAEAEALRIKNQAPDKDKLIEWVNGFSINEINISDKDIQEKKELINQKFNAFKKWALNQI